MGLKTGMQATQKTLLSNVLLSSFLLRSNGTILQTFVFVYSMQIYPGELQKYINIYPYYFYSFRRNTEK